jgi:hypothetical protein
MPAGPWYGDESTEPNRPAVEVAEVSLSRVGERKSPRKPGGLRLPACTISDVAVASPSPTRTINISIVQPCGSKIASVQPCDGRRATRVPGAVPR